jgi:hypothetical protein
VNHLNNLKKRFPWLSLYGVITDQKTEQSQDDLREYYSKSFFDFPIIKDPKGELVKTHAALKTPHATLLKLKQDGSYEVIYQGGVTNQRQFSADTRHYLEENLQAISNKKPLVYSEGKSLGCYIRRI